ncbi:LysR family transcriptional regulator [Phytopseudomonas dryadis]|uniref:LysR family transcriptional regulator n=1 Tax=Phytopseudomonas dryadis TaxID=2487520 RepID=A0ABY1Z8L0_9GAMM|nr:MULTISPECIES: LysR family transcriptional regulator [Pseudomonas]TBV07694.1 LysR family transcriptional regulator [Pseudomonas dryadis]TBV19878.1 LysR family transcriptional regulator [Pseudomonas sp. FRB 230]
MAIDDLALLRLFVSVVDAGSLSAAARAAGISLPAASRRLRNLEAGLGVRLLQRTTRRQSLTEEGELLYRRAVQVLADLEQVEQQLSRQSATVSGNLKVTAPLALGRRRIAPLLANFSALHPGLHTQLDLTDTLLDLVESGTDVAIRFGGLDDSSYISRPLAPNHRVLCASPAYLQRHAVPRHPTDLLAHSCLHIGLQAQADWRFEGEEPVTVRLVPRLAANDGETVHRWALEGHGIARKSIWDVAEDLQAGRLVQVLADYPIPAAPLHAVYPHSRHLAPRVRTFLDYLAAHLVGPG